jgi:hypothetical protein
MAAEWLIVAKGVTNIAEKIFGGISKYEKLKIEERKKVAALLDRIAGDVLSIAKQMNNKKVPIRACNAILTYSRQLPPLVERVYDPEEAKILGVELAAVYDSRRLAEDKDFRSTQTRAELQALTQSIEAAAGTIQASANILRAL